MTATRTPSTQSRVALAAHRLARRLASVNGVGNVCSLVLRHVVRAVPCRIAAFAVPAADNQLAIVATHGYPIELVESIRIVSGTNIIGRVYQSRTALHTPDVTVYPGVEHRRIRYRTKAVIAVPVIAGPNVVGVICLTDRRDERPFTKADLTMVRALAAPAALALSREAAQKQAEAFAQAAIIDPVSGLFNRRYFEKRLDEELQRANRQKTPVALLMIDIDDFKRINDEYGHMAGDAVIRDVSEILQRSVRRFDLCTRFGGEEFAIVMPGSGLESAARIAERIRERIAECEPAEPGLKGVRVTASVGLHVSHDMAAPELIRRADEALYTAKRSGKNRVVTSPTRPADAAPSGRLPIRPRE